MDERNRVYRAYIAVEVKIHKLKMTNQNKPTKKLKALEAEKKSLYS